MADPLSITASIVTLLHISVQVTVLIKQFRDEVFAVDTTLTGLLDDVDGFQHVLESMKETIEESNNKETLQATGHVGSHWKNLARSLEDGADALQKLHATLDGVNKKSSVLDAPRKQLRLKSASEQIRRYREQIQTSHTAIQLSLSTIILWNQVTFQRSTEMIPDKVVPTLDKLYDEFRTFGALLNAKIEKLQHKVTDQNDTDNYELVYMNNLRECVRSAADVVSTASTTLNADTSDKNSVKNGSDFGDVFVKDANEPMLRWFASNTVYEFEDVEAPLPAPSEAGTGDAQTEYQSDSDSDIENDLIRSLFNEGRKRKDIGDLESAVRYFQNCLTRLSSNISYTSLTSAKSAVVCGVSKMDLLEYLLDCYCLLEAWSKAKAIMKDKLSITERQVGKRDELYLRDTLRLAELMMKNGEYVEAHLQARRSLRGFRKLGKQGNSGYEESLDFLIRICRTEGKLDEEDAYAALLASHERKTKRSASSPKVRPLSHVSPKLQSASNPVLEDIAKADLEVSEQAQEILNHMLSLGSNEIPPIETEDLTVRSPGDLEVQLSEKSQSYDTDQTALEEKIESVAERDKATSEQQPLFASRPDSPTDGQSVQPDRETESPSGDDIVSSEQYPLTLASQEDLTAMLTPVNSGDLSNLEGCEAQAAAAEFICMLYKTAANEATEKNLRTPRKDAEFLKAWCNLFHGRDPYYFSEWHIDGYYCMIKINDTHGCTVSGQKTEQKAKEAAVAKVCEMYISHADEVLTLDTMTQRDPASDKEVFIPQSNYEDIETTMGWGEEVDTTFYSSVKDTNIPHITISAETDEVVIGNSEAATPTSEKSINSPKMPRSASDSKILHDHVTGQGFVEKFLARSSTKIRDRQIELVIWDNTGREGYEMMRRLSYEDAHIVLICFDISDPDSFENIDYMWSAEANEYLRDLPKILVGCKKDLRNDSVKLGSLHRQNLIPISPYAADRLAIKIQALAYFETSATKRQGLSELFDYVAEAALRTVPKSKTSGIRKVLSRGI
ncbi:hypothetical protein ACET3X_000902 [Alternaria dauci]|uniref:Azaphilone pigments biosynthesis cluster protein L N-terminal domain-containing protein n=1 Tax=Alternaria dauci TaxID=48095 RepID=A0ABR3UWA3_9PLEO